MDLDFSPIYLLAAIVVIFSFSLGLCTGIAIYHSDKHTRLILAYPDAYKCINNVLYKKQ